MIGYPSVVHLRTAYITAVPLGNLAPDVRLRPQP
jgi:hypothetical protein